MTARELPILFSAPMIRALLAGRKTQTRRIIKFPKKAASGGPIYERSDMGGWEPMPIGGGGCFVIGRDGQRIPVPETIGMWHRTCGVAFDLRWQPGDTLWVREAWKPGAWREDGRVAVDYRASPELTNTPWCCPGNFEDLWPAWTDELIRNGSVCDDDGIHHWEAGKSPLRWRSPIHMPRWASRITLAVEAVAVERLHEISREDAIAEGISRVGGGMLRWENWSGAEGQSAMTPEAAYALLWNSINGPGAWDANPWVAVVSFRRIDP